MNSHGCAKTRWLTRESIRSKCRFRSCSGFAVIFNLCRLCWRTDRYGVLEELGHAVAKVAAAQSEPVLVVASSDMNHYESDAITRVKDERAIARVLALDPRGLYDTVRAEGITMCGIAAAVVMMVAARDLGATSAELVRYATSGDINGDREHVVGYAGIVIR